MSAKFITLKEYEGPEFDLNINNIVKVVSYPAGPVNAIVHLTNGRELFVHETRAEIRRLIDDTRD